MGTGSGPYPKRLAAAVTARRARQGWTQAFVAERDGPSTETQRLIEGAHRDEYGAATLNRLDRALGWRIGTGAALLHRDFAADEAAVLEWIADGGSGPQLQAHGLGPVVHHARSIAESAPATDEVTHRRVTQVVQPEGVPSEEAFGTATVRHAEAHLTGRGYLGAAVADRPAVYATTDLAAAAGIVTRLEQRHRNEHEEAVFVAAKAWLSALLDSDEAGEQ